VLSGKALLSQLKKKDFQKVSWTLLDEYGAEVWSEQIPWQDCYISDEPNPQVVMPFFRDFSVKNLSGTFKMTISAQDDKGKIIARGDRNISFDKNLKTVNISDLRMERNDNKTIRVSFLAFQEGKLAPMEKQFFRPFLSVIQNTNEKKVVFSLDGDADELVGKGKKQINFSFDAPTVPQSYSLKIGLKNEKGELITGVLKKSFLVDGDFGEIRFLSVVPESFLSLEMSPIVIVEGFLHNTKDPAFLEIDVQPFYKNKELPPIHFSENVALSFNEFQQKIPFSVSGSGFSRIKVSAKVVQNGIVLTMKEFESATFDTNGTEISPQRSNTVPILLGFVFVLLVLGGVIFWLWKKGKLQFSPHKNMLWIFVFFAPLIFFSEAQGSPLLEISSPVHNYIVSPSAGCESGVCEDCNDTGCPDFVDMRYVIVVGQACDDVNGNGTCDAGETSLITDGDIVYLYLVDKINLQKHFVLALELKDGETIVDIGGKVYFSFILDTGALWYFSDDDGATYSTKTIDDSLYIQRIVFGNSENGVDHDSGISTREILVDGTPPTPTITLPNQENNQWYKDPYVVTISCGDSDQCSGTSPWNNSSWNTSGNFCNDQNNCSICFRSVAGDVCGSSPFTSRDFVVCDRAGNCTSTAFNFAKFDNVAPSINGLVLKHTNKINDACSSDDNTCKVSGNAQFEAHEHYSLTINGSDSNVSSQNFLNPCGGGFSVGLDQGSYKCVTPVSCRTGRDTTFGLTQKNRGENCVITMPNTQCPNTQFRDYIPKGGKNNPLMCFPFCLDGQDCLLAP